VNQIPTNAVVEAFTVTHDIDLAACCLCDDQIPELPPEDITVLVDNGSRTFAFSFPQSDQVAEIFRTWEVCQTKGFAATNGDMVGYVYNAFRQYDRLSGLIRAGAGNPRPRILGFWTTNSKAPAAALAVARLDVQDEQLKRMILRDGQQRGYLMREKMYVEAFMEPAIFCASRPPRDPLAVIVAGFFFRERLRDIVNKKRARHVFREVGDNGLPKISFIAEPN
jgi:hypothetical protein